MGRSHNLKHPNRCVSGNNLEALGRFFDHLVADYVWAMLIDKKQFHYVFLSWAVLAIATRTANLLSLLDAIRNFDGHRCPALLWPWLHRKADVLITANHGHALSSGKLDETTGHAGSAFL